MPEALEGLRVIEIGSATAGPYATRQLANLGAEVIKIEPLDGELNRKMAWPVYGDGIVFHIYNCDKKDMALDLESSDGQEIVKKLVKTSDVFVENFPAGRTKKWNLNYEVLSEINPALIYCSVNGFGQTGPYAERRAVDTIIQAMSGVLSLTGDPNEMPAKIGLSASDLLAPSFAVVAILGALRYRRRTGIGQHLDISMHDVSCWLAEDFWPLHLTGVEVTRIGNRSIHDAPSNLYRTKDGLVTIAVTNDKEWRSLLEVMGQGELGEDSRYRTSQDRLRNVEDIDVLVAGWVKEQTVREIVSRCQERRVPAGAFQELSDVAENTHTLAREMLLECRHRRGPVKVIGTPFKMSETPGRIHQGAPLLGEDNEVILAQLGYGPEDVSRLRHIKAVL